MKTTCHHCSADREDTDGCCPECENAPQTAMDTSVKQTDSAEDEIAKLKRVKIGMWIGIAAILVIAILGTFIMLFRG